MSIWYLENKLYSFGAQCHKYLYVLIKDVITLHIRILAAINEANIQCDRKNANIWNE